MDTSGIAVISDLSDADIAVLVAALTDRSRRVQRIELTRRTVWIKRYGTEKVNMWYWPHRLLSPLLPPFFRAGPLRSPDEMIGQEVVRIERFMLKGVQVPEVLYRAGATLILSDLSPSVHAKLAAIRETDAVGHEALLVETAAALGRIHAAGLCHGRPHPRDLTVVDGRIGFLDFEEDPEAVMPLADAQARDIWILFFQLTRRTLQGEPTLDRAYRAWSKAAPAEARVALGRLIRLAARFLPAARLIGRVHMGSDLRRFIVATGYLEKAVGQEKQPVGKAGKND